MRVLFGLIAGVALTLAIKAQPTPIAVALSSVMLGVVSTLFAQAEVRPRRRVVRVGKKHVELPSRLVLLKGGKKAVVFKDPMNKIWSDK
jgi:hypothetical protein